MPDLNIANPRVRDDIHKVVGFWLELGLSGFRVDAAPFLIEQAGIQEGDLRAFLARRRGDAILLAEANLPPPTCAACSATRTATRCTCCPRLELDGTAGCGERKAGEVSLREEWWRLRLEAVS